tara:strand:- start:151 stop:858 length:708 start_codon:yes stop_codon:yes gene_type:complete
MSRSAKPAKITGSPVKHEVQFYGAYPSINSDQYAREPENSESRLDEYTTEYVNFINKLNKKDLTILDFGGGLGGHYLTLKENCPEKNLSYFIVDLPESFTEIDSVKYYESVEKAYLNIDKPIDVIYSNGTVHLTKKLSVVDNILNFCKTRADYIFLQRMVLCKGCAYDHFYTFVPDHQNYYSIIEYNTLTRVAKEQGYSLVTEYPTNVEFNVHHAWLPHIGNVCYSNFLFKRDNL